MNSELRHKTVAVAIMYDQASQRFLLWHNPRWHGYAFPMKSFDVTSGMSAEQAALDACREWDIPFPIAEHGPAEPAGRMGDCHYSVGVREYTFYDYHLFGVGLVDVQESALHPDLRFFSFQQVQDAPNVTSSTKRIAEWLVGDRDVVVGVVTRVSTRGREFLLTYTPGHQYFFPSTRLRHDAFPAEEVVRVVQSDLGYEGAIEIVDQVQVDALQESTRFGQLETRFHFHLCLLHLPGTALAEPGNPLEHSLAGVVIAMAEKRAEAAEPAYWRWCTEQEMRNRGDVSPSLASVIHTVLQLAERTT